MNQQYTCAFALDKMKRFDKRHFGDADYFALYRVQNDKLVFDKIMENPHRDMDESGKHGHAGKGKAIIELLSKEGVQILVSRQFGKNISVINKHFIPVMIAEEEPEKVVEILEHKFKWIKDEWNKSNESYKLFRIREGVMKLRIEE